jgi:steroid delta-isomerase-like uncharacterized protein
MIGEGNRIVALFSLSGTHQGSYMGVPATGKRVRVQELNFYRFEDGMLVELWPTPDILGVMKQIGGGPPPRAMLAVMRAVSGIGGLLRREAPDGAVAELPPTDLAATREAVRNKELLRRSIEEVWNEHDWSAAAGAYADDVVVHTPYYDEPLRGRDAFRRFHEAMHGAYPDLHLAVEDVIAEGDLVAARWRTSGTHTGELFGTPATGKRVRFLELAMARFTDGKATEIWWLPDRTAQMSQLGLMPSGPPPPAVLAFIEFTQKLARLFKRR